MKIGPRTQTEKGPPKMKKHDKFHWIEFIVGTLVTVATTALIWGISDGIDRTRDTKMGTPIIDNILIGSAIHGEDYRLLFDVINTADSYGRGCMESAIQECLDYHKKEGRWTADDDKLAALLIKHK